MNLVTIDTGTTNTRVTVWRDERAIAHAARPVGVRDTAITGSRDALRVAVAAALGDALQQAARDPADLGLVLASGMITASVGLHEVPHLEAPVGRAALAAGMVQAVVPGLGPWPVWFVPGVRNRVDDIELHELESVDMMRGEETEAVGLVDRLRIDRPAVIVLPGSHTKFVQLDARQRIIGCATTLAGEMLQALTQHTILAAALGREFAATLEPRLLLAGAHAARRTGLARAAFTVRALELFTDHDRNARANFLLGAVLAADLQALRQSSAIDASEPEVDIVVAGKSLWREAFALLVSDDGFYTGAVTLVSDGQQADLAGAGAIALARTRGLLPPASSGLH